jgi:hypothetical protein
MISTSAAIAVAEEAFLKDSIVVNSINQMTTSPLSLILLLKLK